MKVIEVKRPEGNSFEIVVWQGLYSGANYRLLVCRDCYNEISLQFYEYDPSRNHGADYVGDDKGYHASVNFKTFDIHGIDVAKNVAEAIIELCDPKYVLAEPQGN